MKLQPLSVFVEEYFKEIKDKQVKWKPDTEYVIHTSAAKRVRITIESVETPEIRNAFVDYWRNDELGQQGISADCEDAKEFAQSLLDTLFYHLSPHQTQHIVNALQRDLDKWEAEVAAVHAANPKQFGNHPLTRLRDECPD